MPNELLAAVFPNWATKGARDRTLLARVLGWTEGPDAECAATLVPWTECALPDPQDVGTPKFRFGRCVQLPLSLREQTGRTEAEGRFCDCCMGEHVKGQLEIDNVAQKWPIPWPVEVAPEQVVGPAGVAGAAGAGGQGRRPQTPALGEPLLLELFSRKFFSRGRDSLWRVWERYSEYFFLLKIGGSVHNIYFWKKKKWALSVSVNLTLGIVVFQTHSFGPVCFLQF